MPDIGSSPTFGAWTRSAAGTLPYEAAVAPSPRVVSWPLRTQRAVLVSWLVASDVLALAAAFRLAYWIRFDLQITVAPEVTGSRSEYGVLTALLVPIWIVLLAAFRLYDRHARLSGIQESSRTFHACTTATMIVIVATFFVPQFVISRAWLVSVWLLSFLAVAVNRFTCRRLVYALRRRGCLLSPAVIVGTNEEAASLSDFLRDWQASGVLTCGFVSTPAGTSADAVPGPVLGPAAEIGRIVREQQAEDVIVAITALSREDLLRLCEDVNTLPVQLRLSSGLYELLTTRVEVRTLGTVPLMSVEKARLDPFESFVKGVLDASLAGLGLLLLSPLLLVIAVLVKLESPGPVIHRRRVLGVFGRSFDAWKFRTMYENADSLLVDRPDLAAAVTSGEKLRDGDPRVTPLGRVLRRFSIDELPQLWNVLTGQMSLVGPRMISPAEGARYGRHRMNLLTVKPGMTGLWQVSGRSDVSYEERVRMDMYYVRNYSVWLDLQILFVQTLPAVVKGRGAY